MYTSVLNYQIVRQINGTTTKTLEVLIKNRK